VDAALDNTELEQYLMQLLRLFGPAAGTGEAPGAGEAPRASENEVDPADGGPAGSGPAGGDLPAVSASEARALIELIAARGIAQGELGQLLGLEKSTVSRLAAGLERKGWVRRGRDEGNQRYVRLYLTPQGRVIAGQVWQAWHSRQARIMAVLSEEERSGLAAGLRGLVRGLAAEGLLSPPGPASPPVPPDSPAGTPPPRPPRS
jgi:DNA-binding MarR family transcriptional regulator